MYGQLTQDSGSRSYGPYHHEGGGGYNSEGGGGYNSEGGFGDNYRSYRPRDSLKGKIEQKYWKTKQKVIEKFDKRQDEFVVSGDAEVDARLEAFKHIQSTCSQLMFAVELYQNRIFALSQDENEMGRFLRDQGSQDKTKAGKMMISVGKAQSYAAQQRLSLRVPLVRLYQEVETFRFRAVSDTMMTVEKMELSRSNYRAGLLWLADISKELDPDVNKRLDKFREVQIQVKEHRSGFEKLKQDVVQKIDLLSASRCNLLSATLAAYQQSMLKFLEQSTKTYQSVYAQFKGHPSYQFQILKHIIPNNGIVDDDDDIKPTRRKAKAIEQAEEAKEEKKTDESVDMEKNEAEDDDDKLILFDDSPAEAGLEEMSEEQQQPNQNTQQQQLTAAADNQEADLLGILDDTEATNQPTRGIFGEFESSSNGLRKQYGNMEFEDLLGGSGTISSLQDNKDSMTLLSSLANPYNEHKSLKSGSVVEALANNQDTFGPSIDELLFGTSSNQGRSEEGQTDIDILGDILGTSSIGNKAGNESSFSSQWQAMFGAKVAENTDLPKGTKENVDPAETSTAGGSIFMPSFLMEQLRQTDPQAAMTGAPPGFGAVSEAGSASPIPARSKGKEMENKSKKGKDMSAWFNLFSDLDPLANPDAIGKETGSEQERSC